MTQYNNKHIFQFRLESIQNSQNSYTPSEIYSGLKRIMDNMKENTKYEYVEN